MISGEFWRKNKPLEVTEKISIEAMEDGQGDDDLLLEATKTGGQ